MIRMKQLVMIAMVALLLPLASFADTKITAITMSAKTSAATTHTRALNDAIDGSLYKSANCEDSFSKLRHTPNSVFVFNRSMEFAARNKGLACMLADLKDVTVLYTGKVYFRLCRIPGTDISLTPGKPEFTIGMPSMYSTKKHQATYNSKGVNLKMIPYSGAKSALKGMYAGDVQASWLSMGLAAKQKDRIECFADTDPASAEYIGNQIDLPVPEFNIHFVTLTNSKDPAVLAKLKGLRNHKGFNAFLVKSYNKGTFDVTDADLVEATAYITKMEDNWADK